MAKEYATKAYDQRVWSALTPPPGPAKAPGADVLDQSSGAPDFAADRELAEIRKTLGIGDNVRPA